MAETPSSGPPTPELPHGLSGGFDTKGTSHGSFDAGFLGLLDSLTGEIPDVALADMWIVAGSRPRGSWSIVLLADDRVTARALEHMGTETSPMRALGRDFVIRSLFTRLFADPERDLPLVRRWIHSVTESFPEPARKQVRHDVSRYLESLRQPEDTLGDELRDDFGSWVLSVHNTRHDLRLRSFSTLLGEAADPDTVIDLATRIAERHPALVGQGSRLRSMLRVEAARAKLAADLGGRPRRLITSDDLRSDLMRQAEVAGEALAGIWEDPMYDAAAAAESLGVKPSNRERLRSLRDRSVLLGLPLDRGHVYPAFQFDRARRTIREVVGVINGILQSASDPWGVASWWITPNDRLGGERPVDVLATDREPDLEPAAWAVRELIG